MFKKFGAIFIAFTLITMNALPIKAQANNRVVQREPSKDESPCELKMEQRKLWIDHVLWTRNAAISIIRDLEDKDIILERLLSNQDDIGASIKPYYGEEAGNKLAKLLREHIIIAGQLVNAGKADDKVGLDKYNKLGLENADDIAQFLSEANPNYSYDFLKEMLYGHLQLLVDQVTAELNKDWKASVKAYDEGEDHMIMLADALADGIVKQFPDKFK